MPETLFQTMEKSFELLNPYDKARFIGDRLAWAAGCDLCNEVRIRICEPLKIN